MVSSAFFSSKPHDRLCAIVEVEFEGSTIGSCLAESGHTWWMWGYTDIPCGQFWHLQTASGLGGQCLHICLISEFIHMSVDFPSAKMNLKDNSIYLAPCEYMLYCGATWHFFLLSHFPWTGHFIIPIPPLPTLEFGSVFFWKISCKPKANVGLCSQWSCRCSLKQIQWY